MKRNLYLLLSFVVLASMILTACGGVPATGAPATAPPASTEPSATDAPTGEATSKVVTITFPQEPDSLSPLYTGMWFSQITQPIWLRGLWRIDNEGNPVPDIAAEIPSEANGGLADGGKTITVKLNPDAKWSDGEPLTADDFVFTYEMIISDTNAVSTRYPFDTKVDSVTAADPQTLVIKLNEPFAPWLTSIFAGTNTSTPVLPKHILEPVFQQDGTLDNAEWNRAPTVSAGPFVFNEWESGSHLTFVRNDNWFGDKPKVDQIFFRFVPDNAAQMAAIKSGDSDIGVYLGFDELPDVESSGTAVVATDQGGYVESWFFNFDPERSHPAMQDVRVRQAVVLATDREKITQDLLHGKTAPVGTFWDATPPFGDPNLKPDPYDPDAAAKLLDEAGWTLGSDGIREKTIDGQVVKLKLRYITNSRDIRKNGVMPVVKQMWAQVGIDAELVNNANDVFFNDYANNGPLYGDFDIAQYSDAPAFPDPDVSHFRCSEIPTPENPAGGNFQGYCNPELDKLFDLQTTTVNRDERIKIFYQIEKIMHDDVVWAGMWNDTDLWSVNKRLTGVVFSGATCFWNVTDWDITQ